MAPRGPNRMKCPRYVLVNWKHNWQLQQSKNTHTYLWHLRPQLLAYTEKNMQNSNRTLQSMKSNISFRLRVPRVPRHAANPCSHRMCFGGSTQVKPLCMQVAMLFCGSLLLQPLIWRFNQMASSGVPNVGDIPDPVSCNPIHIPLQK